MPFGEIGEARRPSRGESPLIPATVAPFESMTASAATEPTFLFVIVGEHQHIPALDGRWGAERDVAAIVLGDVDLTAETEVAAEQLGHLLHQLAEVRLASLHRCEFARVGARACEEDPGGVVDLASGGRSVGRAVTLRLREGHPDLRARARTK